MSTTAPWLALAADWMDSDMFDDASQSERLAWVCLLCHVKTMGRAGRAKTRAETFKRTYRLSNRAVAGMMARAQKCGSIVVDGDIVTVCNWRVYQDPKARKGPSDAGSFTKTAVKPTKDATQHPVPSTQTPSNPVPRTEENTSAPTRNGSGAEEQVVKISWCPQIGWDGITDDDMTDWAAAYPACDINRQLLAMSEWLKANPKKATKSAWRRFITNWLSRAQDRGGDTKSNSTPPQESIADIAVRIAAMGKGDTI